MQAIHYIHEILHLLLSVSLVILPVIILAAFVADVWFCRYDRLPIEGVGLRLGAQVPFGAEPGLPGFEADCNLVGSGSNPIAYPDLDPDSSSDLPSVSGSVETLSRVTKVKSPATQIVRVMQFYDRGYLESLGVVALRKLAASHKMPKASRSKKCELIDWLADDNI